MSDSDNYWTNSDKAEEFLALASQKQKETFNDLVHYVKTNPSGATKFVLARCIECGTLYGVRSYLKKRAIKEKPAKTVTSSQKATYEIAKNGGKHHSTYKIYKNKPGNEIEKGIRSLKKQIAKHLEKIKNPTKGVPNYDERSSSYQKGIIKHWLKEIETYGELIKIYEGILKEKIK